jgi:hypothetical protein
VVLAVAGVAVGVYQLTKSRDRGSGPADDREAAREVVARFLELARQGDQAAADQLFTDLAREQMRKGHGQFGPDIGKERPGVTHTVGEATLAGDRGDVPVTMREAGSEQTVVFKVRRQGADWRIYGVAAQFIPGEPDSQMTLDLENPQNLAKELFGIDPEAMGKEWEKNFNQALDPAAAVAPGADEQANEALAPLDRAAFEAGWKADLDAKDRPAGEILKELADALRVKLETTPAQDRALARRLTLQLKGRSRRELAEEVCRRVGLYPVFEERFAGAGKPSETMALRPGPRPHPVAFAGPFAVELTEVEEYAPHATGLLTLRATARDLPPAVAKMTGLGRDANALSLKQVADTRGRDLSDAPDGPRFKTGRVLPDGFDRTFDLPVKNLLRDVTAVKTLRGVVRVPLPERVDSLRIEPLTQGAVARSGPVEVKVASLRKGQTSFNGKQYANADLRLDYKGVSPDRVRVLAYDSQKKLLGASSSGWTGSDAGGNGDFSLRGDPAAAVVKVITVGYAEYEFALDDIPLSQAAAMPEKLTTASFPGHDAPLTVEFVRITSAQFPARAQFRLVNHSDKDIRQAEVRLVYLDAGGRELRDWPKEVCEAAQTPDGKRPPVVVAKNASAVVEVDTPFLPPEARSVRASLLKVVFADATSWTAPPPKK